MSAGAAVRARGLTKFYGRDRGVLDLDFEVGRGEIFGFLGPNGAGKTTTIRLLLDLIRPTAGRIELFGEDPRRNPALRSRIGYLPGDLRLYESLTGRELCAYFARLRGLPGSGEARELAAALDLDLGRPIRSLSKGNRQKVGLVQALMHRPLLLVLDEPTAGLDPLVQQVVYGLLSETRERGSTVFLSSHVLPEVQEIADRVALVREGRLVLVDHVDALRRRAFTRITVGFASPPAPQAFASLPGVRELERRGSTVVLALEGEADALVKALAREHVVALESRAADLEDVFLEFYRGGVRRAA